jgi:hypothetical protein
MPLSKEKVIFTEANFFVVWKVHQFDVLTADVVELLLRHGAAHSAVDEAGLTPLAKV